MTHNRRFTTFGMVAFVDLLGYSARVSLIETIEDLNVLQAEVQNVQEWFDHKTDDEIVKEVQKLQAKTVLAFSDCLVIVVPSLSELAATQGDFDLQLSEIVALGFAQGRCVINGIFIRGGVDHGLWHKRRDTIISPAMVNAYDLERRAVVPMIAISDDLRSHFFDHPHRDFYHESDDPVRRYFIELEVPDGGRRWFIDYFPLFLGEIDGSLTASEKEQYRQEDSEGKNLLREAAWHRGREELTILHKQRILAAREAATDPHVRAKYDWLCGYHDDAVTRVFANPPPEYLIGALS